MADLSNSLRADLDELARACRVLDLEGQGDRIVGHMALRDPDGRGMWMKRAGVALGEIFDANDFVLLDSGVASSSRIRTRTARWPAAGRSRSTSN